MNFFALDVSLFLHRRKLRERSVNRAAAITVDGALLLISMLMLSPMSSESHYIALALAIFSITAMWLKGDASTRKIAGFSLIVSFILITRPRGTSPAWR